MWFISNKINPKVYDMTKNENKHSPTFIIILPLYLAILKSLFSPPLSSHIDTKYMRRRKKYTTNLAKECHLDCKQSDNRSRVWSRLYRNPELFSFNWTPSESSGHKWCPFGHLKHQISHYGLSYKHPLIRRLFNLATSLAKLSH